MPTPSSSSLAALLLTPFLLLILFETGRFLYIEYGLSRGWVRMPTTLFICLAMLFCGLAAILFLSLGPLQSLLAFAIAGGVCLSLFHPVAAVSILISQLLLRPWEALPDNALLALTPRFLAALSLLSWILSRFLRRQFTFVWNSSLTLLSLLFAWLLLSALVSDFADENLMDILKAFTPTYVLCILILNSVEKEVDFNLLRRSITYAIAGVIFVAIVLTVLDPLFMQEGLRLKGHGLNADSNDLAAMCAFCLPLIAVPTLRHWRQLRGRWLELFFVFVLLIGVFLSKSRTGIVAIGAAGLLTLLIASRSKIRILLGFVLSLPVLGTFFLFAMQRDVTDLAESSSSRLNYLITGLRMLRAHPFLGVGVGNYPRFYDTYSLIYFETGYRTAHSTWMLFLAETGFLGFALFTTLFLWVLFKAWQMRRDLPEFLVAILAYGVTMTFLSHSYTLFPYLLMFLTLSASRVLRAPTPGDRTA